MLYWPLLFYSSETLFSMPALFVDQITVIDFAYFHPARGVIGESWIVDVILEGDLDDQGMVFDFAHVKKQIKRTIDQCVDHKFVVPAAYGDLRISDSGGQRIIEAVDTSGRRYRHESPAEAVVLLDSDAVTLQAVEEVLRDACLETLPDNVSELVLKLTPEHITEAYYHYAHGLKKHLGDCQRIAHGHRSRIQIWENGDRSDTLESLWADHWRDIYLGTREDLAEEFELDGIRYLKFSYEAQQGNFSLTLPEKSCDLLETDSTVELIAGFIADSLKKERPDSHITVRAFEGVNKGAIARR